jgi:hypothetical protein
MKASLCLVALVVALPMLTGAVAARDRPIRLAQAAVTPVAPANTSATCMSACSTQSLTCQNSCIATINGTTIIPSMTTVGVTTDPNKCSTNCNSQLTQCQRNCVLQQ